MEYADTTWYVLLVRGAVPELMPSVLFRREKHFKTKNQKIIRCPYCGSPFTIVDTNTRVEIFCHSTKIEITWHEAIPCRKCRGIVGIIYTPVAKMA